MIDANKAVASLNYYRLPVPVPTALQAGDAIAPHLFDWEFNGVDGFILVPNSPSITFYNELTFLTSLKSYKVYPVSVGENFYGAAAVSKGDPNTMLTPYDFDYQFGLECYCYAGGSPYVYFYMNSPTGWMDGIMYTINYTDYHNYTFTFNPSYKRLYVDGTLVFEEESYISELYQTDGPLYIGRNPLESEYYSIVFYSGIISYVIMYSSSRTDVLGHVHNVNNLSLFLDATFFDGSKYIDLSPYGNHGIPYGGVSRVEAQQKWVWVIKGLHNDGYVHLRYITRGSALILRNGNRVYVDDLVSERKDVYEDVLLDPSIAQQLVYIDVAIHNQEGSNIVYLGGVVDDIAWLAWTALVSSCVAITSLIYLMKRNK